MLLISLALGAVKQFVTPAPLKSNLLCSAQKTGWRFLRKGWAGRKAAMKVLIQAQFILLLAAGAWAGSMKTKITIGEIFQVRLPCNPTTGYMWELKSLDRDIAVPTGDIEFQQSPAKPGMVGVGGNCVLGIKGVKPGKTTAVLVYRRSWEKDPPLKVYKAAIKVLPKK